MKKFIITVLLFLFVFWACEESKILSPDEQISKIDVNVDGLEALGDSAWYEAWIIWLEKTPTGDKINRYSIGLLEDNGLGNYSSSTEVNLGYLQGAQTILITIEEDQVPGYRVTSTDSTIDSTAGPSSYKILAATVAANSGTINIEHAEILDFDFIDAYGNYIINTPTDTLNRSPKSGLWFVSLDTTYENIEDSLGNIIGIDTIVAKNNGLNLPDLPSGWLYEGFVILNGDTLSTGRFTKPAGSDNNSQYSDTLAANYPFPGEDFFLNAPSGLTFPIDLSGANIFITMKPNYPSKSNCPFELIPFMATIPSSVTVNKVYHMDSNFDAFPMGNISIEIKLYD